MKAFKTIKLLSNPVSFSYLLKHNDIPLVIPFYHVVSDEYLPHIANLYKYPDTKQFEKDLDFALKYFEPATIDELLEYAVKHKKFPKKKVLFTFDDGLRQCYDVIAPILRKKGLTAIFFVNPVFLDNRELFFRYKQSILIDVVNKKFTKNKAKEYYKKILAYRDNTEMLNKIAYELEVSFEDYLRSRKPYMTSSQVAELMQQGFEIGGHSMTHPLFSKIDFNEQIRQTAESLDYCGTVLGCENKFFAFPFTDYGVKNEFFDYVFKHKIADLTFGTAGLKLDKQTRHLQRIPVEKYSNIKQALKIEYLYFFIRKLFNKHYATR